MAESMNLWNIWNIKNQKKGCQPQLVLDFSHPLYWPEFNTQCSHTLTHTYQIQALLSQKTGGGGSSSSNNNNNNSNNNVCPFIGSTGSKRRQRLLVGSQVFNSLYSTYVFWCVLPGAYIGCFYFAPRVVTGLPMASAHGASGFNVMAHLKKSVAFTRFSSCTSDCSSACNSSAQVFLLVFCFAALSS